MSKLLIYIGENEKFDLESTITVISNMAGVSNTRVGNFIGAVFECNYSYLGRITVIRICDDLETITVEGLGAESAEFAVKLQKNIGQLLNVIDMDYSFNVPLSEFNSGQELMNVINA